MSFRRNNGTHYFLVNKHSQEILDVTSEQYTLRGIEIPYHLGKGKGLRNQSLNEVYDAITKIKEKESEITPSEVFGVSERKRLNI